ncbi:unnamed protein product, partial [Phaeothamnion confervicola]
GVGGGGAETASAGVEGAVRLEDLEPMCSICLSEYVEGEACTLLPCTHIFHAEVRV